MGKFSLATALHTTTLAKDRSDTFDLEHYVTLYASLHTVLSINE